MSAASCKVIINNETYPAAQRLSTLREQAIVANEAGTLSDQEFEEFLFRLGRLESRFIAESKEMLQEFLELTDAEPRWRELFKVV